MSHRRLRRVSLVSLLVACAVVIGPVAAAQASDATIRATVRRDVPRITRSQAKILEGLATYEKTHSVSALVKAIRAQNSNLKGLKTRLSSQSPSSASGTKGKADIIRGLRLIISSNTTLDRNLRQKAMGKPVSKSQLKAAVTADRKGNLDLNAGAKLLKV